MRVIFTIQHPAHVHLFRNVIERLSANGHEIHTFARRKEINLDLLDAYGIDFTLLAGEPASQWKLPLVQLKYEIGIIRAAKRLDPDVLVANGEPSITHASRVTDSKSLVFTDTENARVQNLLAFPFADRIYTPDCYRDNMGEKHERYPGYHELAYLHPNHFEPDPSVVEDVGLGPTDRFVLFRLVSWEAMHDVGDSGFTNIENAITTIESTGATVLITSETSLPASLEEKQVTVDPSRIHHLMAYADLYIGESATMATESAVLGTPAVFVSSSRRGYTDELEDRYGLVFTHSGLNRQREGLDRAKAILDRYEKDVWDHRREEMLGEKIDTTEYIVNRITEQGVEN